MKQINQPQSALVRIVLYLEGDSEKGRNPFPKIHIQKINYTPLAFMYCEDYSDEFYKLVESELIKGSQRLNDYLIISESGFYEMVGIYDSEVVYNEKKEYLGSRWELHDVKVYQLTDDEIDNNKLKQPA